MFWTYCEMILHLVSFFVSVSIWISRCIVLRRRTFLFCLPFCTVTVIASFFSTTVLYNTSFGCLSQADIPRRDLFVVPTILVLFAFRVSERDGDVRSYDKWYCFFSLSIVFDYKSLVSRYGNAFTIYLEFLSTANQNFVRICRVLNP